MLREATRLEGTKTRLGCGHCGFVVPPGEAGARRGRWCPECGHTLLRLTPAAADFLRAGKRGRERAAELPELPAVAA